MENKKERRGGNLEGKRQPEFWGRLWKQKKNLALFIITLRKEGEEQKKRTVSDRRVDELLARTGTGKSYRRERGSLSWTD